MKRIFFIFISSILLDGVYAQNLSIELSVEWIYESTSLNIEPFGKRDSSLCMPYLVVTYRNNTNSAIYFRSMMDVDKKYPTIPADTWAGHRSKDISDIVRKNPDSSVEIYDVIQLSNKRFDSTWEIVLPTEREIAHGMAAVNSHVNFIQLVLEMQHLLDKFKTGKKLSCFNDPEKKIISYAEAEDLFEAKGVLSKYQMYEYNFKQIDFSETTIDSAAARHFIFLKKDEVLIKKLSLIGFYIVGGTFNFSFNDHIMYDHLFTHTEKILLPKKVNSYRLYTGYFLTNSVGLTIKHKTIK